MEESLIDHPRVYRLDCVKVSAEAMAKLSPWIAGFLGLSPPEAAARLYETWKTVRHPEVRRFRDQLAKADVIAIVATNGVRGYLILRFEESGALCFVPTPPEDPDGMSREKGELTAACRAIGIPMSECAIEFLDGFAGLAEDLAYFEEAEDDFVRGCIGCYSLPPVVFPRYDYDDGALPGLEEWTGSLILFHSRDGSSILLRKDGRVAWHIMAERLIVERAASMEDFVREFTDFRMAFPRKGFDPYADSSLLGTWKW